MKALKQVYVELKNKSNIYVSFKSREALDQVLWSDGAEYLGKTRF